MQKIRIIIGESLSSLLFLIIIFGSLYLAQSFTVDVTEIVGDNRAISALTLAILMFVSTVLAPIAILPVVPMIAPYLGPFTTGLASWIGWTLGAIVAFWIARHGGRPLIRRLVNVDKLAQYESRIPKHAHFFIILALRLVLPVDLLSYALGMFSTVSTSTYAWASGLGIMWFAFIFAYLGYAFESGNTVLFATYGVASLIIFSVALMYVRRIMKQNT